MSFNKKKFVRDRREAVVTFIDDNDVIEVKNFDKVKCDEKKRRKSVKDPDKGSASTKKGKVNAKRIIAEMFDDYISDSEKEDIVVSKPEALFQDGDVPGKAVFGFQTPKRKNAMADKAAESAEKMTPTNKLSTGSPRTPLSSSKSYGFTPRTRKSIPLKLNTDNLHSPSNQKQKKKNVEGKSEETESHKNKKPMDCVTSRDEIPKTPYSLRARLKTKIAQVVRDFEDFSDSGDEFVPSDIEEDEDRSSGSDIDNSVESPLKPNKNAGKREPCNDFCNTPSQKRKRKDLTYAITADEYFNSNNGKKNKTSNHTLNRLKNPRLAQDQLDKLLIDVSQKSSHQSALQSLKKESYMKYLFNKWCFCLKEDYSILLYGLGSKRAILNTFHQKVLSKSHVFVINGFFPGLTIKEIVDSLASDLLNIKDIPSQLHEVIETIKEKLSARGSPQVFIIVHNLDGVALRSDKAQALLARLASLPKCSFLASIDHINAPLLWDDKKLSEFNFIWEDVTNYCMYSEETSFENSLLVQRSSSLALASLKNVYQSLTKNGKEIFKILLEDCLANKKNQKYFGIGFSDLYWRCRDNFLVSTDLALRSQLTEFLDHQLVKWRKDSDHLIIPIDNFVLEQFQNILQDAE